MMVRGEISKLALIFPGVPNSINGANDSIIISVPGLSTTTEYTVTSIKYRNDPECEAQNAATATILVNQKPVPTFTTNPDPTCFTQLTTFVNTTGPDPTENYTYEWKLGCDEDTTLEEQDPAYVFTNPATKCEVTLIAYSGSACVDSTTQEIDFDLSGPQPADIRPIYSPDDPTGVILVAFNPDTQTVVQYAWYQGEIGSATLVGSEQYIYLADSSQANSHYVETFVDANGCRTISEVRNSSFDPIYAPTEATIKAYPNPNPGIFQLELSGLVEGRGILRVFDGVGRLMYQDAVSKTGITTTHKVDLNLSAGIYLISYQLPGQEILTTRIQISR